MGGPPRFAPFFLCARGRNTPSTDRTAPRRPSRSNRRVRSAVKFSETVVLDERVKIGRLTIHPRHDHLAAEVEARIVPPAVGGFADEDVAQKLMSMDAFVFEHDPLPVLHHDDLLSHPRPVLMRRLGDLLLNCSRLFVDPFPISRKTRDFDDGLIFPVPPKPPVRQAPPQRKKHPQK